jgi:predicted  nucleic acid-binding Zn-ribbon protein
MPGITKEQINRLVELQQLETDLKKHKSRLEKLPDKRAGLDAELKNAEEALNRYENLLKDYGREYRACESETENNRLKIKKSEEKLGAVKNNKEYQSSLKEISELKTKNSEIEDKMLEYLDRIEKTELEIKSGKEVYDKVSRNINIKKNALKKQGEVYEQKLSALYAERDKKRESIHTDLIEKFFSVQKKQADGVAVAPAENSTCRGCNMNIPPQMYNDLQRCDSLTVCPFCDRILYWEPQ